MTYISVYISIYENIVVTVGTVAGNSLRAGNKEICTNEYFNIGTVNAYIESILHATETSNPTIFFDIDYKQSAVEALKSQMSRTPLV